jgi:hypothetical protein
MRANEKRCIPAAEGLDYALSPQPSISTMKDFFGSLFVCYTYFMKYEGTIVEESLLDSRFVNNLEILGVHISSAEIPADRWHLYKVRVGEEDIESLTKQLKPEHWYMHFWNGDDIIAVFPRKTFRFKHSDKSTWQPAIEYGKSISIPEEQLDFLVD